MGFTTVRVLGRGGMGVVELAVDERGVRVARKRVPLYGSGAEIDDRRRRIRREAEVLAGLDHPGIVRLLAVEDDGADLVLVMPYYAGGTLSDVVARMGPLDPAYVHWLADRLLDALAAAHRRGVVHRDLKPANVLFAEDGQPAIADFGIASSRDATAGLTASGLVMGTPAWMAPEQARGEQATSASDVYSIGLCLAFAATGALPYGDGRPEEVMARAARGRLGSPATAALRQLPPGLRRRLMGLLERDPAKRPSASAAAGGAQGTRIRTLPSRRPDTAHRAVIVVAGLVVAAGIAAGLGSGSGPKVGAAASTTVAVPTTRPCIPLPYQPCGSGPAPFTDGRQCTAGHDDYDDLASNGCEAAPDTLDGSPLRDGDTISANIVPRNDTDTYPMQVGDDALNLCSGALDVVITSPPGLHVRATVANPSGRVVATADSADGIPGKAHLGESCLGDDSGRYTVTVTKVSGTNTDSPYTLERNGSF